MWQVSLVVMIVITCLWSQCECAALGNRSILTSKLYLLFLIKKKAPVVGKAYIRLAKTNNRLCCKPRLKPTRPWGTHRNLSYINSKDSKKKILWTSTWMCADPPVPRPHWHLHLYAFWSNFSETSTHPPWCMFSYKLIRN